MDFLLRLMVLSLLFYHFVSGQHNSVQQHTPIITQHEPSSDGFKSYSESQTFTPDEAQLRETSGEYRPSSGRTFGTPGQGSFGVQLQDVDRAYAKSQSVDITVQPQITSSHSEIKQSSRFSNEHQASQPYSGSEYTLPAEQARYDHQQAMFDTQNLNQRLPSEETIPHSFHERHQPVPQEVIGEHFSRVGFENLDMVNKDPTQFSAQSAPHLDKINQNYKILSSEAFSVRGGSPAETRIPQFRDYSGHSNGPSEPRTQFQNRLRQSFEPSEHNGRPFLSSTFNHKEDDFISITVAVSPAIKQCLFYSPSSNFVIDYQVIRGGHLDLGLFVRNPDGEPILVKHPSPDATLPVRVPNYFVLRPYAICLDNRKASYAEKHVALSIDLDINWENPSAHELAAIENLRKRTFANAQMEIEDSDYLETWKTIITQLEGLFGRMRRIAHLQQKSDNFASIDQSLMEANLHRVTNGSIIQMLIMVAVASVQLLLIRALFDPASRFYRIWFRNRSLVSARC